MKSLLKVGSFLTLLFLISTQAWADFKLLDSIKEFGPKRYLSTQPARLKAGPVHLHPWLRNSVQYDDNILWEPDDAREDVIHHVTPGLILELPIQKHQIAAGYESDFEIFSKQRHERQNDVNQSFFALGDFHFGNGYFNILENFSETSSRSGTTFTSRIPRIDQSINPKLGYQWKRLTFEQGYRHFFRNFRQDTLSSFDFRVHEFTSTVYYDLFARLKALVDYQVGKLLYNHNHDRDAWIYQARVGLVGEPIRNLKIQFRMGPQIRNYESEPKHDFRSVVGALELEYQMRQNLKFKTKLSQEPAEATFGQVNYYKETSLSGGFEYTFRPKWTLYQDISLYKHHYGERGSLGDQVGYRRDAHLGLKTGLRYAIIDWWGVDLAYEFLGRDSNFADFDYADNRVTLTSSLAY